MKHTLRLEEETEAEFMIILISNKRYKFKDTRVISLNIQKQNQRGGDRVDGWKLRGELSV